MDVHIHTPQNDSTYTFAQRLVVYVLFSCTYNFGFCLLTDIVLYDHSNKTRELE